LRKTGNSLCCRYESRDTIRAAFCFAAIRAKALSDLFGYLPEKPALNREVFGNLKVPGRRNGNLTPD
jgi:hypothetical protein